MSTVTIPKKEYRELVEKKLRYDYLRHVMESNTFFPPPVQSRKAVLKAVASTRKYSAKFLKSLDKGLKRSTYFRT